MKSQTTISNILINFTSIQSRCCILVKGHALMKALSKVIFAAASRSRITVFTGQLRFRISVMGPVAAMLNTVYRYRAHASPLARFARLLSQPCPISGSSVFRTRIFWPTCSDSLIRVCSFDCVLFTFRSET